ncbi:alpha/beta hydrolase fold protein [Pseudonocardia dioxanivorans CB1190]|uniref:Alpha/beta hydrolase fold protein n=1 Tax=Pseudonocardia dioxanivorans (strain ATCC 55486 / DSM 44775 / JCM 13855 / CB1190) TaxID=675635 RepID=F4CS44_PSEUX|nr:alpha/beta hydrolase [Pseudonocardia dioxanivorans]AEA28488.1 alpha/beta hydrolase fold protein [Pseudonocardia dioxanivorans CB1190]GJF01951.1 alpha/beta hydrolase [Pseudonocardia sp. D17]
MLVHETAYEATVAETALGPIEFAVVGTGAPVLVVHGTPGGIDAAELMARILPRDGVSAILLSRPGYLGTPLDGRTTVDAQADLMAALLDHLGIARAGVYTWSGGGPAGYRFAVRHPDRVTALVANAACSQAYRLPEQDLATRLMFTTAPGQWLLRVLAAHGGRQYTQGVIADEGDLTPDQVAQRVDEILADPAKQRFVTDLGPTALPDGRRRAGYRNDLDRFAEITTLELEKITVPTLVVQGTADADLPPEHSWYAARTIPGAELLSLDTGTHLALYTHPDAAAAQTHVVEFLLAGAER